MYDITCKKCGSIFTAQTENIPTVLSCLCNSNDFEVVAKELVVA
tara:strand:+ start:2328 stop:2459 length:132 start_codon:yes stop_codon:yes gene_type:complete